MLAKLVMGTIDPARLHTATRAVQQELVPAFLARDGARSGYWMADPATGHVLALTLWRTSEAVTRTAFADGMERALIAERIGLRVHIIDVLPVLAAHDAEPSLTRPAIRWVRVTWVDGIAAQDRPRLTDLHAAVVADQSSRSGFCSSYWIGNEALGDGCAVSFWERRIDLTEGAGASSRRRRRVERELNCRIGDVRQYQCLAVTNRAADAEARTDEELVIA